MSRQWSRSELAQQLRAEIVGYLGAASEFNEGLAKKLKLSRTDTRCLELIGRLGPLTAGRLAEEFHVVAADLRGYGDSSAPEPGENSTRFASGW